MDLESSCAFGLAHSKRESISGSACRIWSIALVQRSCGRGVEFGEAIVRGKLLHGSPRSPKKEKTMPFCTHEIEMQV